MSSAVPAKSNDQPVELALAVNRICDAFEAEWRHADLPRLEHYLQGVEGAMRSALLPELLKIDFYWRSQEGDPETLRQQYAERFPETAALVDEICGATPRRSLGLHHDRLGPFEKLERIGEGGFGLVFRAWDSRHGRQVALKIPRFGIEMSPADLQRFLREAQAAGSLDHPSIARVWDSGAEGGVAYIAYQFVEGENLSARFAEIRALPLGKKIEFLRQLAEAVHYAHERGIVHRDIKPSNVLLTADNRPVLTDFGLALATGGDITRSLATFVGTIDYMSPEQAAGNVDAYGRQTDVWGLGVLCYELLAGRRPFEGATEAETLANIRHHEPKRIGSRGGRFPADLEVLVSRCLEKKAGDRLPSCGLLAEELQRVARGEPIESRAVSTLERSWRWCRRNPRPLAVFAVVFFVASFGVASWALRLAESRQNESVVQQLQLQLERGNVGRRALLLEMLRRGVVSSSLEPADLESLEAVFLTADSDQLRQTIALALLRNRQLFPTLAAGPGSGRETWLDTLRQLQQTDLATADAQSVEAAWRQAQPTQRE